MKIEYSPDCHDFDFGNWDSDIPFPLTVNEINFSTPDVSKNWKSSSKMILPDISVWM